MTKEEFLLKETRNMIENIQTPESVPPTFTLLFNDGTTKSIAMVIDKKDYKFIMQKLCENPRLIACIFISEGWSSASGDDTKSPSECADKEEIILLLYNTRDNVHECHLYKPSKSGILELVSVYNDFHGRLSNPFGSIKNLTRVEQQNAIQEFQDTIHDSLRNTFKKLHYSVPMMFFLTNTTEKVSLCYIPENEWNDKISLKKKISLQCAEPETLAFMLEFPVDPDMVSVILVSGEILEIFNYKINTESQTLEFVNKGIYDGEFSGVFKNNML
jgi:hypothetical protein